MFTSFHMKKQKLNLNNNSLCFRLWPIHPSSSNAFVTNHSCSHLKLLHFILHLLITGYLRAGICKRQHSSFTRSSSLCNYFVGQVIEKTMNIILIPNWVYNLEANCSQSFKKITNFNWVFGYMTHTKCIYRSTRAYAWKYILMILYRLILSFQGL